MTLNFEHNRLIVSNINYTGIFTRPMNNPSTTGRTRTIRLIFDTRRAATATATARYVLPVPAGPMAKTTLLSLIS